MRKEISYVMAPDNTFYMGMVMRRVTAIMDNGQSVVLSETTTGMELDEFQQTYPTTPVEGQLGGTIRDELSYMTDEQLAAMGLTRMDGTEQIDRPKRDEEILEASYTYPYPTGYGWYMLSSGLKAKGKVEADRRQKAIDDGKPDPDDEDAIAAKLNPPEDSGTRDNLGPPPDSWKEQE